MHKTLILGTMFLLLTACSEPTIDGSSDEAVKGSVEKIVAKMSEEEQANFMEILRGIYMAGGMSAVLNGASEGEAKSMVQDLLHGKTAEDIYELANEIKENLQ